MIELLKQKPSRLPRVNRTPQSSLGNSVLSLQSDSNDHLWVVSYADLLMVLLCFFVLFFSQGKDTRDSLIHRIMVHDLSATPSAPSIVAGAATQVPPTNLAKDSTPRKLPTALMKAFQGLSLTTLKEGESVVLFFPDDIYGKGKIDLPSTQEAMLLDLFKRLKPFAQELDLTFVGHTDTTPVRQSASRRIADNFDLSAARAKGALTLASRFGYPVERLRVQGDAAFKRSSRTLSITLQEREGK